MIHILFLPLLIVSTSIATIVDNAFVHYESKDYAKAATLLDESAKLAGDQFDRNNLNYLRGRIAEWQGDWERARLEFSKTPRSSVLFEISLWHRIRTEVEMSDFDTARKLLKQLPPNFPSDLKIKLAENAPPAFALIIYDSVQTRLSQWKRAEIRNDETAMWSLLARQRTDDIALEVALRLNGGQATPTQKLHLAKTFYSHRFFQEAADLYSMLLEDQSFGPESHYELGRTLFRQGQYEKAIEVYRHTANRFPGTDWERDAESQIASCFWRLEDFDRAVNAYLHVIEKYDDQRLYESSIRNLIDVYRVLGNIPKTLEWIDRGLNGNLTTANRQVFLFTKAKIYFLTQRYEKALDLFDRLSKMRLRTAPNGTNTSEVQYFRALTLKQLGRAIEAQNILEHLTSQTFTYHGIRAVERLTQESRNGEILNLNLNQTSQTSYDAICKRKSEKDVFEFIRNRRLSRTRTFKSLGTSETDMVGELVFLRLWDEAFYWANRVANRWKNVALADLAYLASDFKRSIFYADRLRPLQNDRLFSLEGEYSLEERALLEMLFPSVFDDSICQESLKAGVNPLWLRAIIWQESRYDPTARSSASARGLMQFIPETAAMMAAELDMGNLELASLYNPSVSIKLGANYWANLMEELGHPALALAAYNGGITNVRRWETKSSIDDIDFFVSDIGFVQTKKYVMEVFGLYATYAHLR